MSFIYHVDSGEFEFNLSSLQKLCVVSKDTFVLLFFLSQVIETLEDEIKKLREEIAR